jgi:translocation and assembly module TamB
VIRSPWGQDIIVGEITSYISSKTNTKISIKKLFITFKGNIDLQGLYLEDLNGDTLIFSNELEIQLPIWPLITGESITVDRLSWHGLRANISRSDTIVGYNYQFLINAFASSSEQTTKDKNNSPLEISIGKLEISDFNVNFKDEVGGIDAKLNLGKFYSEADILNLDNMKFQVAKMALENTSLDYIMTKEVQTKDEPTDAIQPYLSLEDLSINYLAIHYTSIPDSIETNLSLSEISLKMPKADLASHDIQISKFVMNNSKLQVKLNSTKKINTDSLPKADSVVGTIPFVWPNWTISLESIVLQNNHLLYQQGEEPEVLHDFNPDYIVLDDLNFIAKNILLSQNKSAQFQLEKLSFQELSGISLKDFSFFAALDSSSFSVDNLVVKTDVSSINANLKALFTNFQLALDKPEDINLIVDLNQFVFDLNDAFGILPSLRKNENLQELSKKQFSGKVKASGKIDDLLLQEFNVNWGVNTEIVSSGELKNLSNFNELNADIENLTFNSTRSDIINFISEKDLGITIPRFINLKTNYVGTLQNFETKMLLTIPEGKVLVDGNYTQEDELSFSANIQVIDLKAGELLNNPQIGKITFNTIANGSGKSLNEMDATLDSKFSKLELNGYDYSALELHGVLHKNDGNIVLNYEDENLEMHANSNIQLDSISPSISLDLIINGADLYALGLTEKQIKAKLTWNANFKGNFDVFEFDSQISDGLAVYDEENYYLGPVNLSAKSTNDSTSLDITSYFLNGDLRANANVDKTVEAIQQHIKSYLSDSLASNRDSLSNPVKLKVNMKLSESKLLTDFLVPQINSMDTLILQIDFDQNKKKLTANLDLAYIDYSSKTLDSLHLNLNSTEKEAEFKFGFAKLDAQPFVMNRTFFDGNFKNGLLNLNFNAFDGEKEIYAVRTEIFNKLSALNIHFDPNKLVLQGEKWSIPEDNNIRIFEKKITAKNVNFSLNDQRVEIANDLIYDTPNNIGVGFSNFNLSNLLALFNKSEHIASGIMNGDLVIYEPYERINLGSDFSIDSLDVLQAPLGNLKLNIKSESDNKYNLDLNILGKDIDLSINGGYNMVDSISPINIDLNLNKIGMNTVAILSRGNLKDASGSISGQFDIQGNLNSPKYKGYIEFSDALFNISSLNSRFLLSNDRIKIDNKTITLNEFSIEDERKNKFIVNGLISTEDISDPQFNLNFYGRNFQVMNSTKEDNELYYGNVDLNMDGTVGGKMSFPEIKLNIDINQNTNFTYVLPESQVALEKKDGIIEFVNKENPNNILTRTNKSNELNKFGGIELNSKIKIDQGANFNLIIDPSTGDNLNIQGDGDLDFTIAKNGLMSLTGRYDINDGHYSISLYNLVKRQFDLVPGGSITWHGDPMDANLNVKAKYSIETSASSLMATQTAGASEELQNKYRQKLPFFVYLNVTGDLNEPNLNFQLDMPEDSRGAVDGTVYSRIKQLNSEEDALNKQVFSLLVLRKFYPNSSSDGSSGGATSLVRNNLNDALSEQLNAFSSRLTGNTGIELDFGLNSYTDYQGESTQQRTDLNINAQKKLLNDRLIVQVGSNVNVEGTANAGEDNSIIGNANIQYLLTPDGRWRLKGFRNGQYENIIDGHVFVNGISVLFQRQFNSFNELLINPVEIDESLEKPKVKE